MTPDPDFPPDHNPYASPREEEHAPPRGAELADPGEGPWRLGSLLILRREGRLPDRCLACGQPTGGRGRQRDLSWASGFFVLRLPHTRLTLPFCSEHLWRYYLERFLVSAVIISFLASCFFPPLLLIPLIAASLVVVFVQRLVFLAEPDVVGINAEFIALRNLPSGYLEGLPEFPGTLPFLNP